MAVRPIWGIRETDIELTSRTPRWAIASCGSFHCDGWACIGRPARPISRTRSSRGLLEHPQPAGRSQARTIATAPWAGAFRAGNHSFIADCAFKKRLAGRSNGDGATAARDVVSSRRSSDPVAATANYLRKYGLAEPVNLANEGRPLPQNFLISTMPWRSAPGDGRIAKWQQARGPEAGAPTQAVFPERQGLETAYLLGRPCWRPPGARGTPVFP